MTYYDDVDYHNFDQTYFEGREVDPDARHPAGYWYYPDENLEYDQYAAELDSITGNNKVLIVGCAYGFAIRYLVNNHGWDRVYGMDVSQWAVDNAFADVADRIHQGDALVATDYEQIARDTQGPPKWDSIYSEYLLEHFTDAAAQQALDNMADESDTCIHRIWSGTGGSGDEYFNNKSVADWQQLAANTANGGSAHEWIDYDNPDDSTV